VPLRFEVHRALTPELRASLVDLITDVTNEGGAIGFVAPVDREHVDAHALRGPFDGSLDLLLVGSEDGRPAAALFLMDRRFTLMDHVRLVKTVMVHPKHQGKGYGVALLREAETLARTLDGVELLHLTCRGGLGLERFYEKCGYTEVGRIPRMLRVSADDYRDEIHMALAL
jgi:GNAT superfamily N-acetyltransferase